MGLPTYDRSSGLNYTRLDGTMGFQRRLSYTTNITINGGKHYFNNSSPSMYAHPAYCYNDLMLEPDQMKPSTYCFNKAYFVWSVFYQCSIWH